MMINKCPYCNGDIKITSEHTECVDLFNEETFHIPCPNCGHYVTVTPLVSIIYEIDKCDCDLEEHEYEFAQMMPRCASVMRCKHCGVERRLTEEEKIKYNVPSVKEYLDGLKAAFPN